MKTGIVRSEAGDTALSPGTVERRRRHSGSETRRSLADNPDETVSDGVESGRNSSSLGRRFPMLYASGETEVGRRIRSEDRPTPEYSNGDRKPQRVVLLVVSVVDIGGDRRFRRPRRQAERFAARWTKGIITKQDDRRSQTFAAG